MKDHSTEETQNKYERFLTNDCLETETNYRTCPNCNMGVLGSHGSLRCLSGLYAVVIPIIIGR